jgi:hypothetical protein
MIMPSFKRSLPIRTSPVTCRGSARKMTERLTIKREFHVKRPTSAQSPKRLTGPSNGKCGGGCVKVLLACREKQTLRSLRQQLAVNCMPWGWQVWSRPLPLVFDVTVLPIDAIMGLGAKLMTHSIQTSVDRNVSDITPQSTSRY